MSNLKLLTDLDKSSRVKIIDAVLDLRGKILGAEYDPKVAEEMNDLIEDIKKRNGNGDSEGDDKTKDKSFKESVESWVKEKEGTLGFAKANPKR